MSIAWLSFLVSFGAALGCGHADTGYGDAEPMHCRWATFDEACESGTELAASSVEEWERRHYKDGCESRVWFGGWYPVGDTACLRKCKRSALCSCKEWARLCNAPLEGCIRFCCKDHPVERHRNQRVYSSSSAW